VVSASLEASEKVGPAATHLGPRGKENQAAAQTYDCVQQEAASKAAAERAMHSGFRGDYYSAASKQKKERALDEAGEVTQHLASEREATKSQAALRREKLLKEKARKEEEWAARAAAKKAAKEEAGKREQEEREYQRKEWRRAKELEEAARAEKVRERRRAVQERREAKQRLDQARSEERNREKEETEKDWEEEKRFRGAMKRGTKVKGQVWKDLNKLNEETSLMDLPPF
jgi:hypothetical protein